MVNNSVISTKKRIEEIDIVKALGIIFVVVGHSGAPVTHFIYLFHMSIFFISAGYFFKEEYSDDINTVIDFTKKKFKQLWIPFFVWNSIYILLHNIFIKINVYTENLRISDYVTGEYVGTTISYSAVTIVKKIIKGIFFSGSEPMFGTGWFLKILFMVSIFYLIFDFLLKKVSKKHLFLSQFIVSIILLLLGYICSIYEIRARGIAQVASVYILYFVGYALSLYKDKYINWNCGKWIFITIISFGVLLIFNYMGSVALDQNSYENPLFLLGTSISGWMFLYGVACFIKRIKVFKKIMIIIGKNTLPIMVLHFLSFKIVDAIGVRYYGMPSFCLAAFPTLCGEKGLWWIAYTLVGVGIPLILSVLYHRCFDNMRTVKKV